MRLSWLSGPSRLSGLVWFAGVAGCGPGEVVGGDAGGDGSSVEGSTSTTAGGDAGETFADSSSSGSSSDEGAEPPPPVDCAAVPTVLGSPRWWTTVVAQNYAVPDEFAPVSGGGAVWIVEERLVWIDADGTVAAPLALAAAEHPTALAPTPYATVLVAGWRNAGLSGEVDPFVIELSADGTRVAETTWDLAPDANEQPIAMVIANDGLPAVLTEVSFDVTMPGVGGFLRLDRLDPGLTSAHGLTLAGRPAAFALDEHRDVYLVGNGSSVSVTAIDLDGATIWESFMPSAGGPVVLAIGDDTLWITQASSDAFGGGTLRTLRRDDGEPMFTETFVADDLSQPIETPVGVAASPCGGAWLVAEGRYDGEIYVTLSHFGADGTRSVVTNTPQPPPVSGTSYGEIFGIASAPDGSVVVAGRLASTSEPLLWSTAF